MIFNAEHAIHFPTPIQGATRYNLGAPEGYKRLYDRLIGKPPVEKPPLGERTIFTTAGGQDDVFLFIADGRDAHQTRSALA